MGTLKKIFYTFISLFVFYILFGFFLIPNILKEQIIKNIDENLNAKSNIEKIEFNPLTFDLKVHNFKLTSLENEDLVKAKELQIQLGILKSLDQKHFRIEYILLDELFVNILQKEDSSINLMNILKENIDETKEETNKQEEISKENLAFLIAKIDLKNTNFNFTSLVNKEPYNLNLKDINYTIYDLGTYKNFLSSNNLNFLINKNTEVNIKGAFNINPFKAYGNIDIKDLRVKDFLEFDKNFFNFSVNPEANINLSLNYNLDTTKEVLLDLNSDELEINNLNLIQNNKNIASLNKLDIKKFAFDLKEQKIDFYDTDIKDLNVNMLMDKNGVNFANLVNIEASNEDEKVEDSKSKPWNINFKNIFLTANYNFNNISLNSQTDVKSLVLNSSELKIVDSSVYLKDANLKASNIAYLDKQNKLDIKSNNTNINLENLSVINGDVKIGSVNLIKDGVSFKENSLNLDINSKKLETSMKNLEISKNISFSENILKLQDLNFVDNINKLKIKSPTLLLSTNGFLIDDKNGINFKNIALKNQNLNFIDSINSLKIDVSNIDLNSNNFLFDSKNNLNLKAINLKNTKLHFEDLKNQISLNAKDINLASKDFLITKDSNITLGSLKLTKPTVDLFDVKNDLKIDAKNISLDINNFKLNKNNISLASVKLIQPNLNILNSQTNISVKNIDLSLKKLISKDNFFRIEKTDLVNPHISILLPKNETIKVEDSKENNSLTQNETTIIKENESQNEKKFRLNLGPVDIKNLTLDFEDKNLAIPFKTTISKLNGQISEIKNKDESTSKLEIKGVVDEYGVAKITGIVNPNSLKILTDINMKFQNIAMKNFTPYTAKFVGRAIKDGKLELDLNYNISDSNLKAKNSIIIKKLELGEKIDSPDAMSLPLDLAITLLEDSSNVIDINLPISGNVDDPQFSVASIVWKAFVNLITKAITSPFSLIGSLFNFSEDEIKSVNFDLKESEITPIQKETLDKIALILSKKEEIAIKLTPSFNEKEEKEKFAIQRAENIKEYLIKEKNINQKQIIIDNNLKKSSQNIDLSIEQI
ncbi:DUF748 domain-containing protein [Arcobacter vandammei]|uniref:DUF748 domain-containing protein n=1 Tax=Arcobacter vandammei TaxID=2782243 RepID=UPI0018DF86E3|nr:DUF748 domain-containing protein [Arcobacter vandammei]